MTGLALDPLDHSLHMRLAHDRSHARPADVLLVGSHGHRMIDSLLRQLYHAADQRVVPLEAAALRRDRGRCGVQAEAVTIFARPVTRPKADRTVDLAPGRLGAEGTLHL